MKRALCLADRPQVSDTVGQILIKLGLEPIHSQADSEGVRRALEKSPEIVVIEIERADSEAFEICRTLRREPKTAFVPIVMISMLQDLESLQRGFDLGVDDYIRKPFHAEEVFFRIRACLRRAYSRWGADSENSFGNLKIHGESREVEILNERVTLTSTELKMLRYFIAHPGEVISREQLLNELWGDTVVTSRTIDTHMANLRRKMKRASHQIQTIHGMGYILKEWHRGLVEVEAREMGTANDQRG